MPKLAKQLTEEQIEAHRGNPIPKADGNGLYIVSDAHKKNLRWMWRFTDPDTGLRSALGFGPYPKVSALDARHKALTNQKMLTNGQNPAEVKRNLKTKPTKRDRFKVMAEEWFNEMAVGWDISTAKRARLILEKYLYPKLGNKKISTLSTPDVKPVLREIERRTKSLAPRAKQYIQKIISHAIQEGMREEGRFLALDGLAVKRKGGHYPAITKAENIIQLLEAIHKIDSQASRSALLILLYTASRPSMVSDMRWEEISFNTNEWHLSADRMKTDFEHIVPLSKQVVAILKPLKLMAGTSQFVFPSSISAKKAINRDSLSKVLRENGMKGLAVPHGFRATMRTIARERLNVDADVLEAQLAHAKKGEIAASYDRTQFIQQRHKVMQDWADYLDDIYRNKASEVSIKTAA
jgi:integrase